VKLFIAVDLEGITGVVSERDADREGPAAVVARVHMRADLNAVFEESSVGRRAEVE
jgi:D-aminopeptidase